MNNKRFTVLLTVVCGLVAVFSLGQLVSYWIQNSGSDRLNSQIVEIIEATEAPVSVPSAAVPATKAPLRCESEAPASPDPTAAPTLRTIYSVTSAPTMPPVLSSMREVHLRWPDVVGYLKVPCVPRIDFAVVQRNNTFYLDHDISGAKNVTGAAFLDEACSVWPRSTNLVIYAHNMKSGLMFGELRRMADTSVLAKDPFVSFNTLYEEGTYVPLYIGVCSVSDVPFWRVSFVDEADFSSFVSILRETSDVRLNTDALFGDELLTLVTCVDSGSDDRFVVILRKLREGESPDAARRSVFPGQ